MNYYLLYFSILLYICAFITAFYASIFIILRENDFKLLSEINPKFFNRINRFNFNKTELEYPFIAIELLLYFVASILLTEYLIKNEYTLWSLYSILILTFLLVLVFRVIINSIGSNVPLTVATKFTLISQILMFISLPFDLLLSKLRLLISKKPNAESSFKELSDLVDTVCENNDPENIAEYTLLKNVINFKGVYVSDIMTPRTVIQSCKAEDSISDVVNLPEIQMYSRLPVKDGETMDNGVLGYVLTKDIYRSALQGKTNMQVSKLTRKIEYIPENSSLEKALDILLKKRQMMLLVVDEYGGIEGLLTMEDIVETILGAEILDEGDKFADLRELAKQRRDKRIASFPKENIID